RDLREREDEHEVEEELEVAGLPLLLGDARRDDEAIDRAHARATARARNSTERGEPVARSTSSSQRTDSPGANSFSRRRTPASGRSTMPPSSASSVAASCSATIAP